MNPNNTNDQNKDQANDRIREATITITKIASVLIAIAIVAACYSYTKVSDMILQMVIYCICTVLCLVASVLIAAAVSARRAHKHKRNFFLYDRKKKTDVSVNDLTFDTVRTRLCEFMSIFKHKGKLYIGDLFSSNSTVPEHFKPLFCYELLYELATNDGIDAGIFLSFGSECGEVFAKYLRQNEDYEMATKIYSYIIDFESGDKRIAEFKEYMQSMDEHIKDQMLVYTKNNIDKFN
ncbi:MAG: DUF805 domain-containing protein [Ruminococcaceae bacterium]|nr:DUF805 domain-containing protein [Oscillospiraceae bacterium]